MTAIHPAEPRLRTLSRAGGQIAARVVGRTLGLPPPTTRYTVSRVRVPMRDGVQLVADHYAPLTSQPAGTLLVRGPYGRGFPFALIYARLYADRGYHVVLQSVRGTFGSAGEFVPMAHEAGDGADTAAWLRQQPWFTGRFATLGVSYLGFTQWALLSDPPPELAAAVITAGPHDMLASVWGTGSFAVGDFLGWSDMVAHQEESKLRSTIRQARATRMVARAAAELPLGGGARALLGAGAPWFESWAEHGDPDDPFWDRLRFPAALDRVSVPVLLLGGWQDIFLGQTLQQYRHLRDRGVDVALTMGPWTHTDLLTKGLATSVRQTLDWLGPTWVARRHGAPARSTFSSTGRAGAICRPGHPRPPTICSTCNPAAAWVRLPRSPGPTPTTFRYDPADPTPTTGGPLLSPNGGYADDSQLAQRADVLDFTGAPLPHDLYVYGNPIIELEHASDNPHADLFVRVSEVDPNGRSRNVSESYRRLGAGQEAVSIELDGTAHRFTAGSRIRVLIAGSWFPRYARNLGTGEAVLTARQLKPATHFVHFGNSRLVLPIGNTGG